jgi:hypothetical protein
LYSSCCGDGGQDDEGDPLIQKVMAEGTLRRVLGLTYLEGTRE